jgi:hypothetical protein
MLCSDSQFVLSWRNQLDGSFRWDRSFLAITKLKSHSASETLSGRKRSEIESSLRMGRRRAGFSQAFSGNRSAKFPKNLAKNEKDGTGSQLGPIRYDVEGASNVRVRASLLCNHNNSSKNGTSESTKKRGPPRVWIGV